MPMAPVSCLCLTYARPRHLLEEAVFSFLQQDYSGEKELVVLNDFAHQTIVFDHPEVTVVNAPARFATLGEKRNAAATIARHDLLAVWDDDDLYLPHRLTYSVARYDPARRFVKPARSFSLNDGVLTGPKSNLYHSSSLFHRSLLHQAGGYAPMNSGEDADLEAKFRQIAGAPLAYDDIQPSEVFYIYRWHGTGSYHVSGFGRDAPGNSGADRVAAYAARALEQGTIAAGIIALQPHWRADYSQMVRDYLRLL
jgi:hypothetical protein